MWRKHTTGPELSEATVQRVDTLFQPEDRERAKSLLYEQCGNNLPFLRKLGPTELERFRFAALKISDGSIPKLENAVNLAQADWRDLLVAAGFANDVREHVKWQPKPANEPAEVDPVQLTAKIHDRLAATLAPLGFIRHDDTWRREGEVIQTLRLVTGLTSRIEARFFLELKLEASPTGVMLPMPQFKGIEHFGEQPQGYIFKSGGSEDAFLGVLMEDVAKCALPLFQRFISAAEVQNGFADKTFSRHIPISGQAMVLLTRVK